jgi:hypothetical protein
MMPVRTGCAVTRFFQCIARFLQPLTHRPFGGLCAMLNCLTRFYRGLLDGLASFFHRSLIVGSQCEGYAK